MEGQMSTRFIGSQLEETKRQTIAFMETIHRDISTPGHPLFEDTMRREKIFNDNFHKSLENKDSQISNK